MDKSGGPVRCGRWGVKSSATVRSNVAVRSGVTVRPGSGLGRRSGRGLGLSLGLGPCLGLVPNLRGPTFGAQPSGPNVRGQTWEPNLRGPTPPVYFPWHVFTVFCLFLFFSMFSSLCLCFCVSILFFVRGQWVAAKVGRGQSRSRPK